MAPRFGLGPAFTGRVLLCGGGFAAAGACSPPVLVLLLRRPAPTCRVFQCRVLLAEETSYPGDTTEGPVRFLAAAFACPLLLLRRRILLPREHRGYCVLVWEDGPYRDSAVPVNCSGL